MNPINLKTAQLDSLGDSQSKKPIVIIVPRAYLPQLTGGLEISANEIAQLCIQQGYDVHLAAGYLAGRFERWRERLRRRIFGAYCNPKQLQNVMVYNDVWHPVGLPQLINKLNPQAVLFFTSGTDSITRKIIELNFPTAIFMCGVHMSKQFLFTDRMKKCLFVCDSSFMAAEIKRQLGITARKINPVLPRDKYSTAVTGQEILVINPNPKKGGAIVLQIAKKMPHRQFLVVGGWQHDAVGPEIDDIEAGLKALPNVQRLPNTDDLRPVFERSYCLLMPCLVQEAYGRIAAEVQIAGLPVVASTQGALAETVGDGGITIDYLSPINLWVSVLDSLFCDKIQYAKLSALAKKQADKPERQTAFINAKLAELIVDLSTEVKLK